MPVYVSHYNIYFAQGTQNNIATGGCFFVEKNSFDPEALTEI